MIIICFVPVNPQWWGESERHAIKKYKKLETDCIRTGYGGLNTAIIPCRRCRYYSNIAQWTI
jgi:hypothetical protein